MIAGKSSARPFLRTRQAFGEGELDTANLVPGTGSPADGLTKVRSEMVPLVLLLLESGHSNPGSLRPLRGVVWMEGGGRRNYRN